MKRSGCPSVYLKADLIIQQLISSQQITQPLFEQFNYVCVCVPPAGVVSWSPATPAYGQSPAVSPHIVSAALPHCDWTGSQLLTYQKRGERKGTL